MERQFAVQEHFLSFGREMDLSHGVNKVSDLPHHGDEHLVDQSGS